MDSITSRIKETTDRCGNKTEYSYDASGRTTRVLNKKADDTPISSVDYSYDKFDNLTEICRGDGLKYELEYNAYHNLESIGIHGKDEKLVEYQYKKQNGKLKEVTYANGCVMKLKYNSIGQIVDEEWTNHAGDVEAHYKYVYDGRGNIARSIDYCCGKEYTYIYNDGRMVRATESIIEANESGIVTNKTVINNIFYVYGEGSTSFVKKRYVSADGEERIVWTEKPEAGDAVLHFEMPAPTATDANHKQIVTSHSKSDAFGRKVFDELQIGTSSVFRTFEYHNGQITQDHLDNDKFKSVPTTYLVKRITLGDGRTLEYTYDNEERITSVVDSIDGTTSYAYDALGQLTSETVNGVTTNFTYDNYGNILTKGSHSYSYSTGAWKDLLVAYDGQPIVYDEQGNPTTYLGHTLVWEKGRQLKSYDGIAYTYNANGIRTSKTVNGIEHKYWLEGTKIIRETWNDNVLEMLYDNEDSICGIVYNRVPYYFQKNLQGDIIGLVGSDGVVKVRYSYDAWGVCTVEQDSSGNGLSTINPYRYRGYYFDEATGLYYLQSRYYNPVVGRFVNGDKIEIIKRESSSCEKNIFSYCSNNPTNSVDLNGDDLIQLVARILFGIIVGIIAQLISDWITYLFKKYIEKEEAVFHAILSDYLASILTWALACVLPNIRWINAILIAIPILVKHVGRALANEFDIRTLIYDLAAGFIAFVIGLCINKYTSQKSSQIVKRFSGDKNAISKITSSNANLVFKTEILGIKLNFTFAMSSSILMLIFDALKMCF